ncbi:CMP-N-acetylneuraminate-beta-galactosamide-alpha-2,3-sialyltransferase 4 isoform X2 [Channa argus]|uniref:CMP-N-acetylneuraminate-beta-galactosamide- alpha-2,3-sialyltransferase 4 isoform X2 n=1 Tax=Channa argus TaxID=215402 RepID=UPI003521173A
MSQKATKTWCLRLLPVLLFFISFVTYYWLYSILRSYLGIKPLDSGKSLCHGLHRKWENLNFNISRRTQLFLKLEDFFWREYISKLALPYGVKGSELLLLKVLAVSTHYQLPADIEKLECRTCVVIGNGFTIKNSSLGSKINKYDVVIRLNNAPVKGYENDVGRKTTMRFFYPESASHEPIVHNEPTTLMVLVPFKPQDLRWLKEILYDEKRLGKGFWRPPPQIWRVHFQNIRVLDPHFLHQTAQMLQIPTDRQPVHPTTGMLAVFVALNYCDVVDIAGFGYPNLKSGKDPIHYYGNDNMNSMKNSYHDLTNEANTLKKLEKSGFISKLPDIYHTTYSKKKTNKQTK